MSDTELQFRTSTFGGFQKQDVLNYIETSNQEHREKLEAVRRELAEAEAAKAAQAEETAAAQAQTEAKEKELQALREELAAAHKEAEERKLEISRALATDPKLLLLDEPAAGMNPNETAELMETIELVRKQFDVTVLLIEHDMKLVSGICEYLYVLNFGRLLAEGTPSAVLSNPEVITAYLGD